MAPWTVPIERTVVQQLVIGGGHVSEQGVVTVPTILEEVRTIPGGPAAAGQGDHRGEQHFAAEVQIARLLIVDSGQFKRPHFRRRGDGVGAHVDDWQCTAKHLRRGGGSGHGRFFFWGSSGIGGSITTGLLGETEQTSAARISQRPALRSL